MTDLMHAWYFGVDLVESLLELALKPDPTRVTKPADWDPSGEDANQLRQGSGTFTFFRHPQLFGWGSSPTISTPSRTLRAARNSLLQSSGAKMTRGRKEALKHCYLLDTQEPSSMIILRALMETKTRNSDPQSWKLVRPWEDEDGSLVAVTVGPNTLEDGQNTDNETGYEQKEKEERKKRKKKKESEKVAQEKAIEDLMFHNIQTRDFALERRTVPCKHSEEAPPVFSDEEDSTMSIKADIEIPSEGKGVWHAIIRKVRGPAEKHFLTHYVPFLVMTGDFRKKKMRFWRIAAAIAGHCTGTRLAGSVEEIDSATEAVGSVRVDRNRQLDRLIDHPILSPRPMKPWQWRDIVVTATVTGRWSSGYVEVRP